MKPLNCIAVAVLLLLGHSRAAWSGDIHDAIRRGDIEAVQALLRSSSALIESPDEKGLRPAYVALVEEQADIFRYLLDRRANPNARNGKDGLTLLIASVADGSREDTALLLEEGADPNVSTDTQSITALYVAVQRQHRDIVKLLLDKGANPDLQGTERKWTPLHVAASTGDTTSVTLLLSHGASPNVRDTSGLTSVYVAVGKNELTILRMLLAHGGEVNVKDAEQGVGNSPLHVAAQNGNLEIVRILVKAGAEVNSTNAQGETPAYQAFVKDRVDVLDFLVARGASRSIITPGGARLGF